MVFATRTSECYSPWVPVQHLQGKAADLGSKIGALESKALTTLGAWCLKGSDLELVVLPGKLTCPLKINGWKMYFLLK